MSYLSIIIPPAIRLSIQKPKSPTIYLRLRGGIGNQLFIYFAGLYYADKLNMNLEIDTRGSDHNFDLSELSLPGRFCGSKFYWKFVDLRRLRSRVYLESEIESLYAFNSQASESFELQGYFQNSFYYFALKSKGVEIALSDSHKRYLPSTTTFKDSAFIHIRGGDYLKHKESIGCLDSLYYKEVKNILNVKKIEKLFVLTDDEVHASSVLSNFGDKQIHYIKKGVLRDFECLVYFSKFEYLFLANSTYSWWGAQLASTNCQVFAPASWSRGDQLDSKRLNMPGWTLIPSAWLD